MPRKSKQQRVARQVLDKGIGVLALGVGLYGAAAVLGSASPMLKAVAGGFRSAAPYALAAGALVCLLGWLLRERPSADQARPREPDLLPKDSTDFSRNASSLLHPATEAPMPAGRRAPADRWSSQVFEDIEWRRFEAVCGELFAQAGFEPRSQSHGADGGVDIWLHSRHADGPVSVVQCKHWNGRPVGVRQIREFFGVMASRKVARGTFATTSSFTEDAVRFARENAIHLLDGPGLLALIAKRTPEQQDALLRLAYEGDYWRPTCASCGTKMVDRTARKQRSPFWGCADYPRCRFTLPMRAR